jgi:drug/metabolite transporter (DMT)-like permease
VGAPVLFVILWSTGFVFSKESIKYGEPMTILTIRYAAASVLCAGLALVGRAGWPSGRSLVHVVAIGLLMLAVYIGGVFAAIDHGLPTGVAALIVGIQPLLSACLVGVVLGERVSLVQWAGFILGLAGVALVLLDKLTFDDATVAGVLLATLALIGITAGTLYQKRFGAHVDVRAATAIQYAAASLAVLAVALPLESQHIEWTASLAGSLAWMVVVLSVGTMNLLYVLIRRGEVVKISSLFYLVPPVTALFGYFWFGETLGAVALGGMALAVVGVALVQRGGERTPSRTDQAVVEPG